MTSIHSDESPSVVVFDDGGQPNFAETLPMVQDPSDTFELADRSNQLVRESFKTRDMPRWDEKIS